jgi:hypothetical protein
LVASPAVILSVKEYSFIPQSIPLVKDEGIFMQAEKPKEKKVE